MRVYSYAVTSRVMVHSLCAQLVSQQKVEIPEKNLHDGKNVLHLSVSFFSSFKMQHVHFMLRVKVSPDGSAR